MYSNILIDNNKIKPIKALMFETALSCSSEALGFCGLCEICYARRDAKQHKKHYDKTLKASQGLNEILSNPETTNKFNNYLRINNFKVIRFNLVGDFKDSNSIKQLEGLAKSNPEIKFYGYTKRLDLKAEIKELLNIDNIYLNSELKPLYKINNVNQYKAHNNIKKYYNSNNKCFGLCAGCGYCYNLKNECINTFVHAPPSHLQRWINNDINKDFLLSLINKKLDLNASFEDIGGGYFVNSFIELLNNKGIETPIKTTPKGEIKQLLKTVPDLIKFIELEALKNE